MSRSTTSRTDRVTLEQFVRRIRARFYKRGYRPKPGSIFYSPSLALRYALKEADFEAKLIAALKQGEARRRSALDKINKENLNGQA